jgi:hypothetical protein
MSMVGVHKRYVKKENLKNTVEELMRKYENIRIQFKTDVEGYVIVKAWGRRGDG